MGREIVYCEGCGNSLREADFERGRARMIDNKPYCTQCRPVEESEPEPAPRRSPSGRVAAQPRKSATGGIPIVPAPRRVAAPASNPLPLLAGAGGVAFLVLIFAVTQSGPKRPPSPEPESRPPVEIPTYRPAPTPVEPPPRDPPPRDPAPPPPPPPKRDPLPPSKSSDPLVAPSAAEKLDAFIAQIRQRIQEDKRKERTEEILRMFSAAMKIAGPRIGELEKLRADYLDTLDETTRQTALWSDWKITTSTEAGSSGLLPSHGDRKSVYMTHPVDRTTPASLEREVSVLSGRKTTLSFWVACHQQGDFELRVLVDGKVLLKEVVGPPGSGWRQKTVDLSSFSGKRVVVRLENMPTEWQWEHAYWCDLKITSENY